MSTSLLYHALGIKGYHYERTTYKEGAVIFRICHVPEKLHCSSCDSDHIIRRGTRERTIRTVPIGGKQLFFKLDAQRVECLKCGAVRQVELGFADPRLPYTRLFERYALDLSLSMTISDVAKHLGVSWDVIKEIQKRYLKKKFERPRLKHLRFLAIDEISVGKRHRYLTVVLDLESGAVVFVGDGRAANALEPFWIRLRKSHAKIEAVAMDMSKAYIEAVKANIPEAAIVFDHFHVIQLFNEKLSDLRRDVQREAEGQQKEVLKGTRWLLLKRPKNLDPKKGELERLEAALSLNKPLATAYYMKEELALLWQQKSKAEAEKSLNDWIDLAHSSGIGMLEQFAGTLDSHRDGILAYYDFCISTGPLEGTNNKIKTMQRKAYGFRDKEFFKLKILGLHMTRMVLVG